MNSDQREALRSIVGDLKELDDRSTALHEQQDVILARCRPAGLDPRVVRSLMHYRERDRVGHLETVLGYLRELDT